MTSAHAIEELATPLISDPTNAVPLLRLLFIFFNPYNDPVIEATKRDVMLFVWTKTDDCENAMNTFLTAFEKKTTGDQKAA